jgi:hypothetical protein
MQEKTHIHKGLVIAAVLIIFKSITHFTNTVFAEWTVFVFGLIILLGVIISVQLFSKENNYKFNELFSYGFKVTAVITCIYFIFIFLETKLFFPNYIHERLLKSIEQLKQSGIIDQKTFEENIDQSMALGKKVETYKYFAGSIMSILFLGVLGAVIGSVISKNKARN